VPAEDLMSGDLQAWCDTQGYVYAAHVPGTPYRVAFVVRTITGDLQLCLGALNSNEGVSDRWSYDDATAAILDMTHWEEQGFEDEPVHWVRHQPSNRRRYWFQDGTKREWVAP
jgi:hypothetical protein